MQKHIVFTTSAGGCDVCVHAHPANISSHPAPPTAFTACLSPSVSCSAQHVLGAQLTIPPPLIVRSWLECARRPRQMSSESKGDRNPGWWDVWSLALQVGVLQGAPPHCRHTWGLGHVPFCFIVLY